jgi:hypothetical protein
MTAATAIPILSLVVAALAVFVGPIISWRIAKRQVTANFATSNKQIIAPMRQAWINNLRDLLSKSPAAPYIIIRQDLKNAQIKSTST